MRRRPYRRPATQSHAFTDRDVLIRLGAMSSDTDLSASPARTMLALKEWAAVGHALLDGRQTVLLRKGGIHEKRFEVGRDTFVLFPTVAHSHRERVRDEHVDLISLGEADVADGRLTVRCGVTLAGVVPVERPEGLADIQDLHIWTAESVRRDRLEFRPRHPCLLYTSPSPRDGLLY